MAGAKYACHCCHYFQTIKPAVFALQGNPSVRGSPWFLWPATGWAEIRSSWLLTHVQLIYSIESIDFRVTSLWVLNVTKMAGSEDFGLETWLYVQTESIHSFSFWSWLCISFALGWVLSLCSCSENRVTLHSPLHAWCDDDTDAFCCICREGDWFGSRYINPVLL